jgi:hypothetical protein
MPEHHHRFHEAICVFSSVPEVFLKGSILRMSEDEGMKYVAQPLIFALYGSDELLEQFSPSHARLRRFSLFFDIIKSTYLGFEHCLPFEHCPPFPGM